LHLFGHLHISFLIPLEENSRFGYLVTKVLSAVLKYVGEEIKRGGEDNGTRRGFSTKSFSPHFPYIIHLVLTWG
jgi:hypothetical protein